jgi:hypothetical protein
MSLQSDLAFLTTRIEALRSDGSSSFGTGFFFSFKINNTGSVFVIVTNKHVVDGCDRMRVHISRARNGKPSFGEYFGYEDSYVGAIPHPDPSVDLVVIPVGHILQDMKDRGIEPYIKSLDENSIPSDAQMKSINGIEEIFMIGYPTALWDDVNNMPIIRRGITATHYSLDYRGNSEFMIDAACFPGSSGSPVVIANEGQYTTNDGIAFGWRFYFLGVLWGGPQLTAQGTIVSEPVPTSVVPLALTNIPTNLGFCVKSQRLRDFAPLVEAAVLSSVPGHSRTA